MFFTFEVFHLFIGWLNAVVTENISVIILTLETSQATYCVPSIRVWTFVLISWLNAFVPLNIVFMSVTFDVFHLFNGWLNIFAYQNMLLIFVTFDTSQSLILLLKVALNENNLLISVIWDMFHSPIGPYKAVATSRWAYVPCHKFIAPSNSFLLSSVNGSVLRSGNVILYVKTFEKLSLIFKTSAVISNEDVKSNVLDFSIIKLDVLSKDVIVSKVESG